MKNMKHAWLVPPVIEHIGYKHLDLDIPTVAYRLLPLLWRPVFFMSRHAFTDNTISSDCYMDTGINVRNIQQNVGIWTQS